MPSFAAPSNSVLLPLPLLVSLSWSFSHISVISSMDLFRKRSVIALFSRSLKMLSILSDSAWWNFLTALRDFHETDCAEPLEEVCILVAPFRDRRKILSQSSAVLSRPLKIAAVIIAFSRSVISLSRPSAAIFCCCLFFANIRRSGDMEDLETWKVWKVWRVWRVWKVWRV